MEGEKARGLGDMPRVLLGERGTLSGGRCIEPGDAVVSSSSRITLPIGHLGASSPAIARSKAQEKPKPGRGQSSRSNPEAERAPNPGERVDRSAGSATDWCLEHDRRVGASPAYGPAKRLSPVVLRVCVPATGGARPHRSIDASQKGHIWHFANFYWEVFQVVCQQAGRQRKKCGKTVRPCCDV